MPSPLPTALRVPDDSPIIVEAPPSDPGESGMEDAMRARARDTRVITHMIEAKERLWVTTSVEKWVSTEEAQGNNPALAEHNL